MADVMAKHGVRGSVSRNIAVGGHYPEIIERCCALGWELFSHGTYNTRYFYDLSEEQQRAVIADSRETIRKYSGQSLDGWLTAAITNDETTQHVLAEEGIMWLATGREIAAWYTEHYYDAVSSWLASGTPGGRR